MAAEGAHQQPRFEEARPKPARFLRHRQRQPAQLGETRPHARFAGMRRREAALAFLEAVLAREKVLCAVGDQRLFIGEGELHPLLLEAFFAMDEARPARRVAWYSSLTWLNWCSSKCAESACRMPCTSIERLS